MYKTWVSSGKDVEALARSLEVHLNEFADEVISVAYAVDDQHNVLAVYRTIEFSAEESEEAVSAAEQLIDQAQH